VEVQLSSVNAILPADINSDGKTDLLIGGNKLNLLPQFCRLDASFGHVLVNKGGGDFTQLSSRESGLNLRGEVKDIVSIQFSNTSSYLFLQNNEQPLLFRGRTSTTLLATKRK
jgi:hypothetical protein